MKHISTLTCLLLLLSCVKFDGNIPSKYREPFNVYKIGETIYFDSDGDTDTLKIVSIDSAASTHGPDNLPFKRLELEVEYLPLNRWKYDHQENSKFFVLHKDQYSNDEGDDKFYFQIEYRGCSAEVDLKKGARQILFPESVGDSINGEAIEELHFSLTGGLESYKLRNGRIYKKR